VEAAAQLERDQVRLQVDRPAADLQAQQRVIEEGSGVAACPDCSCQQAAGPGMP
jgi:hypothetical protein